MPYGGTTAGAVEGTLNYIVPGDGKPRSEITKPGTPVQRRSQYNPHGFAIRDARGLGQPAALDREGFALAPHDSAVRDFYDAKEVERVYYPEVAELVKRETGAFRVHVFDHNVRNSDETVRAGKQVREPVRVVHNDYTVKSGPQRVRDLIGGEEAEELVRGRFAMVNVWRPIRGPLQTMPLAICDARSIAPDDLIPPISSIATARERRGLSDDLESRPPLVLLPRPRGVGSDSDQVLRLGDRRHGALHLPHRVRGPDRAGGRAAAREHRSAHHRFLPRRRLTRKARRRRVAGSRASCPRPCSRCARQRYAGAPFAILGIAETGGMAAYAANDYAGNGASHRPVMGLRHHRRR